MDFFFKKKKKQQHPVVVVSWRLLTSTSKPAIVRHPSRMFLEDLHGFHSQKCGFEVVKTGFKVVILQRAGFLPKALLLLGSQKQGFRFFDFAFPNEGKNTLSKMPSLKPSE